MKLNFTILSTPSVGSAIGVATGAVRPASFLALLLWLPLPHEARSRIASPSRGRAVTITTENAMKITMLAVAAAVSITAISGCSHPKKVVKPTTEAKTTPAKPADKGQLESLPADMQVSQSLAISGDIVKLCNIKVNATANPTFDYDKAELSPEDRAILDQLATCL